MNSSAQRATTAIQIARTPVDTAPLRAAITAQMSESRTTIYANAAAQPFQLVGVAP